MKPEHTPEGAALTACMLEIFRCNGALLAAGDELVRDIGLTSARWQVLGALALHQGGSELTVAAIARNMGLARQSVQRTVNELHKEGLVVFSDNPHHKRARLVMLSEKGSAVYQKAHARQVHWSNALAKSYDAQDICKALALLQELRERCGSMHDAIATAQREDKGGQYAQD